jgi:hypothetical protein
MGSTPRRGKNIDNAISDLERSKREAKKRTAQKRKPDSTIKSGEGELVTVASALPHSGCVPDTVPCGACVECKKRAALRTALQFGDPIERGTVLARLGLVLLEEPHVREAHTSPVMDRALADKVREGDNSYASPMNPHSKKRGVASTARNTDATINADTDASRTDT